jgi:hypothetical protein
MRSSLPGMSSLLEINSVPVISSLPAMSAYECDERSTLKEEKETNLRSRTIALCNYVNGGDAFHNYTKCSSDIKYSTIDVTYEELYNRITPMAENNYTLLSALLSKYVYRYITQMRRHPQVKRPYQDQGPTNVNNCTLRSAFMVKIFTFSKIDWNCEKHQEKI